MEIFLDLDGTLVDISERYYQLYSDIVKKLGGRPLKKTSYWRLKRSRTSNEKILFRSRLTKNNVKIFSEEFLRKIDSFKYLSYDRLFPYTIRLLDFLAKDHDLYLISYRKNTERARNQLARLGLTNKFLDIRIGQLGEKGYIAKLKYIRKLTKGGKKLVIGDTDDEILAAKDVGATSLAVLSGIRNKSYLEKLSPDYISQDIRSIPLILDKIIV